MKKTPANLRPFFLLALIIFISHTVSVKAMEFKWASSAAIEAKARRSGNSVPVLKSAQLFMKGEIKPGDAERFRVFMLQIVEEYRWESPVVILSSNGGDVIEALKISKIIRVMYAKIWVVGSCASACFFLYLAATNRIVTGDAMLGVHRVYIDPKYYSALSLNDAEKKQRELTAAVKAILEVNSVSQGLIDRMNRTSSAEVYWLTEAEIEDLGEHPPWYEELLIARCGYGKSLRNQYKKDGILGAKLRENINVVIDCEVPMLIKERQKLPELLSKAENFK